MVIALEQSVGLGVTEAGAVMTGCLLATAVAWVSTTRLAEGSRRIAVARAGLALAAVLFAVAAVDPNDLVTILAVIVGGAGAGGALSTSGDAPTPDAKWRRSVPQG
ncbi:hypothetical protein GCM10027421_33920 [Microbacterium shaanxiense]